MDVAVDQAQVGSLIFGFFVAKSVRFPIVHNCSSNIAISHLTISHLDLIEKTQFIQECLQVTVFYLVLPCVVHDGTKSFNHRC